MATTHNERVHRVGVLAVPGAQMAAVLGLRDLLSVASTLHAMRGGVGQLAPTVVDDPVAANEVEWTVLIVPPSLGGMPSEPLSASWGQLLHGQHNRGCRLCSVCVGAVHLADLGLLDGRPATTHWGLAADFARRFPLVLLDVDRLVVDDGDIWTAGGLMAWTDLGLHLVGHFLGPTTLVATARHFLIEPGGREQRFYRSFAPVVGHGDTDVLRVQRFLQGHFTERLTVPRMAAQVGVSARTLMRRFRKATGLTTTEYVQNLRVHRARELLESTVDSQQSVAWAVGYEDPGAFRAVFQKWTGLTPSAYRDRFRPRSLG